MESRTTLQATVASDMTCTPTRLEKAITDGEIIPFYQPVVDGRCGAVRGAEVLARWQPAHQPPVPPDHFIPLAEKTGLLTPLTRSLLRQVTRDLSALRALLPGEFHLGLNISASPTWDPSLTRALLHLKSVLYGRGTIILEVTERLPLISDSAFCTTLHQLHRRGIQVALDDFGTGYANLACLTQLPLSYLKMDKSFVRPIGEPGADSGVADCIIAIAEKMHLGIIAEGVETRLQARYLVSRGVYLHQGYYWSHPLSRLSFTHFLQQEQRRPLCR